VRTVDCFAQSISAKTKDSVSRVLTVAKIGKTTNRSWKATREPSGFNSFLS